MIVTRSNLNEVIDRLSVSKELSFDTETTGLHPYSGDRVFSVIIADSEDTAFYFNFNTFAEIQDFDESTLLGEDGVIKLSWLFQQDRLWYASNAMYDLHMLYATWEIELSGDIYCTMAQGRIEYNDHYEYGLDAALQRLGDAKDDRVKKYIKDNHLFTLIKIPDKKEPYKKLHFERVPFTLITEYALQDARGTFKLGRKIKCDIERAKTETTHTGKPGLLDASRTELVLMRPLFNLERTGILLDVGYIGQAIEYEREQLHGAIREFESQSGVRYINHFTTLEKVFASERQKFTYGKPTKKGIRNPTFDEETLRTFDHPLAKIVLHARDKQSRLNFYNAYLFNRDKNDVLHPQLNSWGTATGRFSSTNPNMQNITSESLLTCNDCGEGLETREISCLVCNSTNLTENLWPVRRAFKPRPDFCFFNPDYSAQEYRLMLDYAKRMRDSKRRNLELPEDDISYFELLRKIKEEGLDVHKATAQLVGVSRKEAKTVNFALLYGAGVQKMADQLGISFKDAEALRNKYFAALPYVKSFIKTVKDTARNRGYIQNLYGRRWYFDSDGNYRAPNHLIQGTCGDIMRLAMIGVDSFLQDFKSNQLLSTHDETLNEIHYSEVETVPQRIVEIMETVYKYDYLPLTVSAEWSDRSLADKLRGMPHGKAA